MTQILAEMTLLPTSCLLSTPKTPCFFPLFRPDEPTPVPTRNYHILQWLQVFRFFTSSGKEFYTLRKSLLHVDVKTFSAMRKTLSHVDVKLFSAMKKTL